MQISVNFGTFVRVDANKNLASLTKKKIEIYKIKPYKIIITHKKNTRKHILCQVKKCVSELKLRIFFPVFTFSFNRVCCVCLEVIVPRKRLLCPIKTTLGFF